MSSLTFVNSRLNKSLPLTLPIGQVSLTLIFFFFVLFLLIPLQGPVGFQVPSIFLSVVWTAEVSPEEEDTIKSYLWQMQSEVAFQVYYTFVITLFIYDT